ncbi:carbohydrate ABC transporter permease [Candidatus Riflebacteria bacterium]
MIEKFRKFFVFLLLSIGALLMITPFIWSLLSSFKPASEILSLEPAFLPKKPTLANYAEVLKTGKFLWWYLNSLAVAIITTFSVCFFSSLAGYSLAKYKYVGKEIIFYTILSTMMIPMEMLVIPWFIVANYFGALDTWLGIMFPGLISAFGVFLMKQFMEGIPDALIEAARIDGTSEFKIFYRIILPNVKPALASLAIFTFIGSWDAFLWPLIVTTKSECMTLPVGLQGFAGVQGIQYHLIIAAANLVIIPVLAVFLIFQKQIIKGMATSGIK